MKFETVLNAYIDAEIDAESEPTWSEKYYKRRRQSMRFRDWLLDYAQACENEQQNESPLGLHYFQCPACDHEFGLDSVFGNELTCPNCGAIFEI